MGMIENQAVSATNTTGANAPSMSPVAGTAAPAQGWYTATVVSYNTTTLQAGIAVSWLAGYVNNGTTNLTVPNLSTVALAAGHTVVVLGSGTSSDAIIGSN